MEFLGAFCNFLCLKTVSPLILGLLDFFATAAECVGHDLFLENEG